MTTTDMMAAAGAIALAFFVPGATAQAADADRYAEKLAELRAEVESLSEQVELQREDVRAELRSYDVQKTDLETQVRREELRLSEMTTAIDKYKEELEVETGVLRDRAAMRAASDETTLDTPLFR